MKKREKRFWKTKYGSKSPKYFADYIPLLNLVGEDLDDEELGWLCNPLKSVGVLKLDENRISNEGVKHLLKLDSILELQLKNNPINGNCIPVLNQLTNLSVLHVGHTDIGLQDILGLGNLSKLELLLLNDDPQKVDTEIITQFQNVHPACKLVINSRPAGYYTKAN